MTDAVGALSATLTESGALIRELSPRHASLEDLFFKLTEGEASEEPRSPRAGPSGATA